MPIPEWMEEHRRQAGRMHKAYLDFNLSAFGRGIEELKAAALRENLRVEHGYAYEAPVVGRPVPVPGGPSVTKSIVDKNRERSLYLLDRETDRVVFIPQGWCDDFANVHQDEDAFGDLAEPEIYCWYGNPDCLAFKGRDDREWMTWDAQEWFKLSALERMRELSEAEAWVADPDLFELLDAVNSGAAV